MPFATRRLANDIHVDNRPAVVISGGAALWQRIFNRPREAGKAPNPTAGGRNSVGPVVAALRQTSRKLKAQGGHRAGLANGPTRTLGLPPCKSIHQWSNQYRATPSARVATLTFSPALHPPQGLKLELVKREVW
jgi:hypothetical protein